jgi:hypothetical protein
MRALAQACRDGMGGPVDRMQALRWFLRMLDWGDTRGLQEAVHIASLMSVEEITEAARLAGREDDARTLIERAYPTPDSRPS